MTANVNMRNVQEMIEDTTKEVKVLGRKAYLTYLGAWGLGYDGVMSLYTDRWHWVEKAEKRGKVVEKDVMKIFEAYQKDFPGEVAKLAESVQSTAGDLYKSAEGYAEDLAKAVRRDVNVSETVENIVVEAKAAVRGFNGNGKKAADKAQEMVADTQAAVEAVAESVVDAIWKGYDELGVKDIVAGLEGMEMKKLEELRAYESGSKNRVTVLREIDARMQAMTS
ncbi:MAG: hypothetical protein ACRC1H_18330 [Caldilineaceae bacterium]